MVNDCPDLPKKKPKDELYDPLDEVLSEDTDDENTIDEEENLASEVDIQEEVTNLQREGDMPLEELLALYSYENNNSYEDENKINKNEKDSDENTNEENSEMENDHSEFKELLKLVFDTASDEESSDDDYEFIIQNPKKWRNSIMVGKDYQAILPEISNDEAIYEKEDTLVWDPKSMTDDQIEQYLRATSSKKSNLSLSQTEKIKDDAQSLYLLLKNGYNIDKTVYKKQTAPNFLSENLIPFSNVECINFENGLCRYGKNFWKIQQNFVKTRNVSELVHFYYLWKKTERHDLFVLKNRSQKKKYSLNPGSADLMVNIISGLTKKFEHHVDNIPGLIENNENNKHIHEIIENKEIKMTRSKSKLNQK